MTNDDIVALVGATTPRQPIELCATVHSPRRFVADSATAAAVVLQKDPIKTVERVVTLLWSLHLFMYMYSNRQRRAALLIDI